MKDDRDEVLTQVRIMLGKLETATDKDGNSLSKEIHMRFKQLAKEIKLQAKEYARRLGELNGEKEEIKSILSKTITRVFFDAEQLRVNEKISILDEKLDTLVSREVYNLLEKKVIELSNAEERRRGKMSWSIWIAVASVIIALASVIVNILKF